MWQVLSSFFMSATPILLSAVAICLATCLPSPLSAADRVKTANGVLEAAGAPNSGVRVFKGIPFAKPPVGDLRWREPQPAENWTGVRRADHFGPRCMQRTTPMDDYLFRSESMSEDCLYLNVWTPAKSGRERLPVLVYIYGGGFQNGDGSEPRYDGESMARKGIVAVTLNYRLNIFGFFSHPELSKESPHHGSGNYGLLDQVAALEWVERNIAAFGGDPHKVTIAGESAGSISVSALMASPLSRKMIAGAIGESGAMFSSLPPHPLAETEDGGVKFAESAGARSLAALRAMTAEQLQEFLGKARTFFSPNLDGYFLAKPFADIYTAGEQAQVPLLAGSNSEEAPARMILGPNPPTQENFANAVQKLYGEHAEQVLKVYAASTPEEVLQAATDLASARFIAHGTWKWAEMQAQTGGHPVYRYLYAHARPRFLPASNSTAAHGAVHSAEIQYAMGNLDLDQRYAWEPADHKVSEILQAYFANFIKTGNPNGPGLAEWPAYAKATNFLRMRVDVNPKVEPEPERNRYLVLDGLK